MSTISRKKRTALLVYVTRDQHRAAKRFAREQGYISLSHLVRDCLSLRIDEFVSRQQRDRDMASSVEAFGHDLAKGVAGRVKDHCAPEAKP